MLREVTALVISGTSLLLAATGRAHALQTGGPRFHPWGLQRIVLKGEGDRLKPWRASANQIRPYSPRWTNGLTPYKTDLYVKEKMGSIEVQNRIKTVRS